MKLDIEPPRMRVILDSTDTIQQKRNVQLELLTLIDPLTVLGRSTAYYLGNVILNLYGRAQAELTQENIEARLWEAHQARPVEPTASI